MTASGFTAEQMVLFRDFMNEVISDHLLSYRNRPLFDFAMKNAQIKPAASDEQRTTSTKLYENGGSVDIVNANGVPTGSDYNSSLSATTSTLTRVEYGAPYSIAARNKAKWDEIISTLLYRNDAKEAMKMFVGEGFSDRLRGEMSNDMFYKLESAIGSLFDDATSDTVYGDTVIANSGTKFNFDNLLSGSVNASTLDSLYNNLHAHQNERGVPLDYATPRYFFSTTSNMAAWKKLLNPMGTVNVNYRQVLEGNGGDYWVDHFPTSGNYTMAFTEGSGFCVEMDTAMPVIRYNEDEYGNAVFLLSWIWVVGWKSRMGVVRISHA